jgi:hypothetical protein
MSMSSIRINDSASVLRALNPREAHTIDLSSIRMFEYIYAFGKSDGWDDLSEVTLLGNANEVVHYLYAYMLTRTSRARWAAAVQS